MNSDGFMKRTLKIVKGHELNIHVSSEISCEQSFMNPAYRQAIRALMEIVRQTSNFHKLRQSANTTELSNLLFQYSTNVIAFTAQRGGGKTRTMLSFSKILSTPEDQSYCRNSFLNEYDRNWLNNCRFYSMSPISPSAIESSKIGNSQSILYVVLSRMYQYVDELLSSGRTCPNFSEKDRSELFQAFHKCLSGINGIKRPQDKALDDISILQDISDGIALRKHFFDLVQCILKLITPYQGSENGFLIIQLDDADAQISNGYAVLEDVRKYLVIPNLVILMSADIEMLHNVILQDHLRKFPDLHNSADSSLRKELSRMCRKHIDKLIPPSHMVHLPQLDRFVEANGNALELQYVQRNGEKEVPVLDWTQEGNWNLQNMLLMLIYRKIGVVFVSPKEYLHNIIPRTLRGLNQLVYFLSEMPDIPQINATSIDDADSLVKALQRQIPVQEDNLNRFIDYFSNEWIEAKVKNLRHRVFLRDFCKTAGSNRVRLAISHIRNHYKYDQDQSLRDERYYLDTIMTELEVDHRTEDDFMLFFSIRTILSLESHKFVLAKKKSTIEDYLLKVAKDQIDAKKARELGQSFVPSAPNVLVFDFNPDQLFLPKAFLVNKALCDTPLGKFNPSLELKHVIDVFSDKELETELKKTIKDYHIRCPKSSDWAVTAKDFVSTGVSINVVTSGFHDIVSVAWDIIKSKYSSSCEALSLVGDLLVNRSKDDSYSLNFMNFITLVLRLGDEKFEAGMGTPKQPSGNQQRIFYLIQEAALLIATNWDVQCRIFKALKIHKDPNDPADSASKIIKHLYMGVDDVLNEINGAELMKYINLSLGTSTEEKFSIGDAFCKIVLEQAVSTTDLVYPIAHFFAFVFGDSLEEIKRREEQTGSAPKEPTEEAPIVSNM